LREIGGVLALVARGEDPAHRRRLVIDRVVLELALRVDDHSVLVKRRGRRRHLVLLEILRDVRAVIIRLLVTTPADPGCGQRFWVGRPGIGTVRGVVVESGGRHSLR